MSIFFRKITDMKRKKCNLKSLTKPLFEITSKMGNSKKSLRKIPIRFVILCTQRFQLYEQSSIRASSRKHPGQNSDVCMFRQYIWEYFCYARYFKQGCSLRMHAFKIKCRRKRTWTPQQKPQRLLVPACTNARRLNVAASGLANWEQ